MDKTKENPTDKNKPLSKKERRAQKIQARQVEKTDTKDKSITENVASNEQQDKPKNNVENVAVVPQGASKQLTEKELRKLEWEKKLAEQKLKEPKNDNISKAELKTKRREAQEAQRQAKSEQHTKKAEQAKKQPQSEVVKTSTKPEIKKEPVKKPDVKKTPIVSHKVQLVQHLYINANVKDSTKILLINKEIHPAFTKLGVQFTNMIVLGSNARCLALLAALKRLVEDIQTPPKQEYLRYLEVVLQMCTNYLQNCRPFAVSMSNALRHFKMQVTQVDTKLSDNEKKTKLQDVIDTYINDDIRKAGDAISLKVNEKITNGDVILIFGCSSLIKKILFDAHKDGKKFEVIVVDARPLLEGKEMLRRLVVTGIKCSYVLINAVSYVMNSVTKVLLGAHALLTNGYVMSRIGTAQVALVAQSYNKPVLVCCETYKFSEKVQTDSFVYNEVDDPDRLTSTPVKADISLLSKWKSMNKLTPLNLLYDVTPPDLVTAVVTEIAILPCTSVPVVLRINANEIA